MNPIPHIDPVGTLLFPLVGIAAGGVIFGWAKPVPVQTALLRNTRRDHLLIALAGPMSNILAALGFLVLHALFMHTGILSPSGSGFIVLVLHAGVMLNVILAVFNLLPIPPLDGSWILGGLLPGMLSRWFDALRPYGFFLLLLLLLSGAIWSILGPILGLVRTLMY
jgi:Zn-dependent protease